MIETNPKGYWIQSKRFLERAVVALNEAISRRSRYPWIQKEAIALPNIRYYDNDRYEETGELFSSSVPSPK